MDIGIRWPNDIFANRQSKIGDVVVKKSIENPAEVVCGVRLNVHNDGPPSSGPKTCLATLVEQQHSEPLSESVLNFVKSLKEIFLLKFLSLFQVRYVPFTRYGFGQYVYEYYNYWLHWFFVLYGNC